MGFDKTYSWEGRNQTPITNNNIIDRTDGHTLKCYTIGRYDSYVLTLYIGILEIIPEQRSSLALEFELELKLEPHAWCELTCAYVSVRVATLGQLGWAWRRRGGTVGNSLLCFRRKNSWFYVKYHPSHLNCALYPPKQNLLLIFREIIHIFFREYLQIFWAAENGLCSGQSRWARPITRQGFSLFIQVVRKHSKDSLRSPCRQNSFLKKPRKHGGRGLFKDKLVLTAGGKWLTGIRGANRGQKCLRLDTNEDEGSYWIE